MHLSPDQAVLWRYGFINLNETIVTTWGLMLVLWLGAMLITRKLETELKISRWQCGLEIIVSNIMKQIEEAGLRQPEKYIGFLGTLFLFIATAALATVLPGYEVADRVALDHGGPGDLRLRRRAGVRHRGTGPARLSQLLSKADGHHAAIQHH